MTAVEEVLDSAAEVVAAYLTERIGLSVAGPRRAHLLWQIADAMARVRATSGEWYCARLEKDEDSFDELVARVTVGGATSSGSPVSSQPTIAGVMNVRRDQAGDQREAPVGAGITTDALNRAALARREAASDRMRASQDRRAGASDRTQAELDRNTALADRGASAKERGELARLDATNRAKSEFLSRMSHELRTPLNAVLGFAQLLELDELRAEQRDSVEHITKAGRHLLGLIDEVLDICRVESGELRLSLEPVSLHEVVGEAVGMLRPLAAARVVGINGLVAGGEEHVRADRQRLQQVVVNLLANAVKYNREGGEVSVVCEAVSDGRLRLVVADTGIGIAEHDLARLFLPFERLGAEQSDVEGTGLGLALTKQMVEAMGGQIGATSQTGVGSSFWVELPLADAPGEQPEDTVPPTVAPAPISAGACTVLYVEDNLSNVKLVERIVARRPEVTLIVAMQGGIALELAREHQPSLILLDLHLPDVSGEEVLRRLRADPRTSATPVVVLSSDATSGQVQRLRANGATDYLTKPFDIPRLLAVIDGTGSTEQPTAAPEMPSGTAAAVPLDATIVASLHNLGRDSEAGTAGIRDLVTTFLDDSGSRFADLRIAVRDGDVAGVARLAHSLVGSSANLGARNVADGCREVEARAMAGDLGDVPMLVARLDEAFAVARAALRAEFLVSGDPAP